MIFKELDSPVHDDKYSKAGHSAEKQMAFYLQRAFAKEKYIIVLNGIRLQDGEEVCQIDHLVVHEYGMVIVESKSVTTKVKINDDGSWERFSGKYFKGMRSPVIQAKMQAEFLKNYLNNNKEELLGKLLGIQKSFKTMSINVLLT